MLSHRAIEVFHQVIKEKWTYHYPQQHLMTKTAGVLSHHSLA